ncbi:uncharacterized protein MEPE_06003 [Melanopsichium pennsylvanicum]|uniref:Uncharacterized protein n=2 Tax=Melanopsichium pennsylvanicum TaxID=63383 RepID=A0AAJ4XTY8_9BASI|nr:putative protein [Melanopsichium pennsylvanicum 4]SNX87293.1 uncharacterized protein MEPE_06003 [Melanopsichium pennsylvanicum]
MSVPDSNSPAFAGTRANQLTTSSDDFFLSQPISASASDLKRPASAASSNDDSQTLSRTKTAKAHYGKAARAFLAKDLQTALIHSQHAVDLLSSSSQLGSSLTASLLLNDTDLDVSKLIEKVAILRLTVFTQVYTDKQNSPSIRDKLTHVKSQSVSDAAGIDRIVLLLFKQPQSLISHLWFEALRLCSQTSGDSDAPSLDPTPETIHLAIELPASVISSAVLAALRLDAINPAARTGTNAARLIAEWYLASFSSAFGASPPTPKATAAYEKIVGLYSLHVLASRLGEWEYAREFVGYSSLAESVKFGLLEQINEAQAHLGGQMEREQEAIANAKKAYDQEKAKRADEEKKAKEAAAAAPVTSSKGRSKVGRKDQGIASSIGNFLTRKEDAETDHAATGASMPVATGSRSESSGSGSEAGSRSRRQRSQSPTYFSPRNGNGTGESSSSSSPSPALSPGSSRSLDSSSKQASCVVPKEDSGQERRSVRRSSSSRSSDYDGGNESSTSAASNHSRTSSRIGSTETSSTKDYARGFKDDTSYASTRAHLSRYMEGDHDHLTSSNRRATEREVAPRSTSSSSHWFLSTISAVFDFRKTISTRNMLMTAIVMMLVFYRVAVRQRANSSTAKLDAGTGRRNAAARDARSKLVGKKGAGSGGLIGFNWLFVIWTKVLGTIKMGTQVTYL